MYFAEINYLWLMLLLPLLFGFLYYTFHIFRKFDGEAFKHGSVLPSWKARCLYAFLRFLSLGLIILGVSEPHVLLPTTESKYENVRLFFLIDVSKSMKYAEDVKPNRLEAVKKELLTFFEQLKDSYEVSIIPFAGDPNIFYCPLTYSKQIYLPLLERLDADAVPVPGTDLTGAFNALKDIVAPLDSGVNIVVLLTDGGREEADSTNRMKLNQMVSELSAKNCRISAVGVGGEAPCPLMKRDNDGNFISYVFSDTEPGAVSYSQLDEDILKVLTVNGEGKYFRFGEDKSLYNFLDEVLKKDRKLGKSTISTKKFALQSYFFGLAALLYFLCLIGNRKR